jgi:hypothetical protein
VGLLKFVENDYRILGCWEGRSSFPTFLAVVLVNLLRDTGLTSGANGGRRRRPVGKARSHAPGAASCPRRASPRGDDRAQTHW